MSVLTFIRGILHATVVYISIHLMQSVAFSVNSCQQLRGLCAIQIKYYYYHHHHHHLPIDQVTNQPIPPDGQKIVLVSPYFLSLWTDNNIYVVLGSDR